MEITLNKDQMHSQMGKNVHFVVINQRWRVILGSS